MLLESLQIPAPAIGAVQRVYRIPPLLITDGEFQAITYQEVQAATSRPWAFSLFSQHHVVRASLQAAERPPQSQLEMPSLCQNAQRSDALNTSHNTQNKRCVGVSGNREFLYCFSQSPLHSRSTTCRSKDVISLSDNPLVTVRRTRTRSRHCGSKPHTQPINGVNPEDQHLNRATGGQPKS